MDIKYVAGLLEQTDRIRDELAKMEVTSLAYRSLAETLYYVSTSACNISCFAPEFRPDYKPEEVKTEVKDEAKPKKTRKAEPVVAETPVVEAPPACEADGKVAEPYVAPEDTAPYEQTNSVTTEYTLEDVRNAVKKALASGKLPKPKEFFDKFGASRASDVPPERYAELMAELEKL